MAPLVRQARELRSHVVPGPGFSALDVPRFERGYASRRLFDATLGHVLRLDRTNQRLVRTRHPFGPVANQQLVAPRPHRAYRGFFDAVVICDGVHFQVVTHDNAPKADPLAEQWAEHLLTEGGGMLRIELREQNVRRHDRLAPGLGRGRERYELHPAEALHRMVQTRKREVTIHRGVPVAGEVFGTRRNPLALEALDQRGPELGHPFRVVAERPVADHRIVRIAVDIQNRGVVLVKTQREQASTEQGSHGVRKRRAPPSPDDAERRQLRKRRPQALNAASFLVDRNQQGLAGKSAERIDKVPTSRNARKIACKEDGASDLTVALQRRKVRVHGRPGKTADQELAYLVRQTSHWSHTRYAPRHSFPMQAPPIPDIYGLGRAIRQAMGPAMRGAVGTLRRGISKLTLLTGWVEPAIRTAHAGGTRLVRLMVIVGLTGLHGPTDAHADESADVRLDKAIRRILHAPELRNALAGVHVRSMADGRMLFGRNEARLFNPASNMKILTTAAALWYLGASYRFRTTCWRDENLRAGVLHGNLYVKGHGDPMLTTEELFGFVNEIALTGIREIRGDLVVDDTFFDRVREGPGWEQETGDHAYAAPVGALSVNFNTFELYIRPGAHPGAPLEVSMWPEVPSLEVTSSGYTRGRRSRTRVWVGTTRQPDDRVRITIRGAMAVDHQAGRVVRRRVHDPTRYAGEMIHSLLEMRGVDVKGTVRAGVVDEAVAIPVGTRWSKSLAEIVSILNKYSNNFMAEQLLKTLGAEMYEQPGSWALGNRAIAGFLRDIGIDDAKVVLGNGSGLNDANRITPEQVTRVLQAMYDRFEVRPEFVASLAVAGSSGTITRRFEDSPAEARLRAKTGSLRGVSALSGYVVTRDGQVLAFSVMMNDYEGRARTMWRIQDEIGVALAQFSGPPAVAAQSRTTTTEAATP